MTDNTQPDSGRAHIIRFALEMGLLWIDGDGRNKVREALDALDILEAQLSSSGFSAADMATASAQGFRDGVASAAASAGSEPVAWPKDATEVREFFSSDFIRAEYVADDHQPCDEDRYYISAHDFLSAINWWADFPHHPSTPEGMVATDAMIDAGKKMLHNSNGRGAREKVERIFNAMLEAAAAASAGSGKGE